MKSPKANRLTQSQLEQMAKLYPDHANEEIADIMGLSKWTIKSRAQRHGWHKSSAYISALCHDVAIRYNNAAKINTKESYKKREATRAKIHATDKMRIKWGLKPISKRHYRTEPRARLLQRNRLERLGYIVDNEKLVAYYTRETKRAKRIEKVPRGQKIGSIRGWYDFAPIDSK